jgi:hypothetical protein
MELVLPLEKVQVYSLQSYSTVTSIHKDSMFQNQYVQNENWLKVNNL